jgi:murein DD-endopeptidase MepM/ murein hydrolase activator NlpD
MRKTKYILNTKSGAYEKYKRPIWLKILNILGVVSAITVTAAITVWLAYKFIPSPKEQIMKGQQSYLQEEFDIIQKQLASQQKQILTLQQRDASIYRNIFEAAPLTDTFTTIDEATFISKLKPYDNATLLANMKVQMQKMQAKINLQSKSYKELEALINNKQIMLASLPSIQPINANTLEQISSGFGIRIDPIYKVPRLHTGLDFTAAIGTPIYATGNGTVAEVSYAPSGYGNFVKINHGYNYETLYGHMVKAVVKTGQAVQRGTVIGYVGNTGKSTGPHLHYEVIKNGDKIDPIHFFYNDIKPAEYEQMVQQAANSNQSMD